MLLGRLEAAAAAAAAAADESKEGIEFATTVALWKMADDEGTDVTVEGKLEDKEAAAGPC